MEERWGPPPGDQYVDGDDFVIAGLSLGNVVLAIQPPRGYGDDPVGIYHDPELPPTHHYLACYWWLDRVWGADALIHLGKHGTLEWLPGKMLALSAGCAPDAALGDVPLVYPFVVNDPGEGVQAKRRAHADDRRPPGAADDAGRDLRRAGRARDAAGRLRPARGARPAQAAGAGGAHLVGHRAGEPAGRARRVRAARRPRRPRRPHRRLPVRGQGHPDQGRAARARPRARGRAAARAGQRHAPAGDARRARAAAGGGGGVRARRAGAGGGAGRGLRGGAGGAARALPGSGGQQRRRGRPARGGAGGAAGRARGAGLGGRRRGFLRARRAGRRRRARAALRRRRGRAAHPARARRDRRHRRRAARAPRARGAVGQPHARSRRRAADRAQLLLRRPARAAVRAVLGRRPAPGRRAARAPPARRRRAAPHGRARRLGHVGDADPGRRRRPRSWPCSACARSGTRRTHGSPGSR